MHYTVLKGEKEPILVMHGILASHKDMLKIGEAINKKGHKVIMFDSKGYGKNSGWKTDAQGTINEARNIIERYNISILIGHSLGGLQCMNLAQCSQVKKAFIISAPLLKKYLPDFRKVDGKLYLVYSKEDIIVSYDNMKRLKKLVKINDALTIHGLHTLTNSNKKTIDFICKNL